MDASGIPMKEEISPPASPASTSAHSSCTSEQQASPPARSTSEEKKAELNGILKPNSPEWVKGLDKKDAKDERHRPWKAILGGRAQDKNFLAYKAWDADPKDTDLFRSLGACPQCGGKGCASCQVPYTFAG